MPSPSILVTGATGLLGSYLIRDLLARDVPLAVLARPSRKQSARDRVEALVAGWETCLGRPLPRPTVIEGDLTRDGCGLDADAIRWVGRHCGQVLNNAASLAFVGADRDGEPWRTNVGGIRNVLALAEAAGIRHVHHVSTAYVCGLRSGTVLERDLDCGQSFGNDYEASKAEAERLVRTAAHLDSATVYRPSIIVGDSHTGYTSTYHGYFATLRLGHTLLTRVPIGSTSGRALLTLLGIDPGASKNFVPVDWVSAVIAGAVVNPAVRGETLHVTHPRPLSMAFVAELVQEAVESYSEAAAADDPDRCDEQWFADNLRTQLGVYAPYFRNDPVFDTATLERFASRVACPTLDRDTMLRMSKFAIAHEFGRHPPSLVPIEPERRRRPARSL
jgi:thioester reductase-like protein